MYFTLIKNGWVLESWLGGSEHFLLKDLGLIPSNQKEGHRLLGARHVCGAQMCHSYIKINLMTIIKKRMAPRARKMAQ